MLRFSSDLPQVLPDNLSGMCILLANDLNMYRPLRDPDIDVAFLLQLNVSGTGERLKYWQLDFSY